MIITITEIGPGTPAPDWYPGVTTEFHYALIQKDQFFWTRHIPLSEVLKELPIACV